MMGPLVTFLSLLIFQTGCARMPSTWFAAIRDDPTPQAPENHQPRLELKSDPGSTITPEFDVQGLSEGETVMVLRGADANCSSGSIVGSRVAKASALIPRIRTLNPGASGTTAEFRAKVRRADGTVFCSEAVTVNLPAGTLPASTPYFVQTLTDVKQLATGNASCALTQQGTVWCWGNNTFGQLGNGQTGAGVSPNQPVQVVGLNNVVQLSNLYYHSFIALTGEGDIYWWGKKDHRQNSPQSNIPVLLGRYSDVVQIKVGFILKTDGTVASLHDPVAFGAFSALPQISRIYAGNFDRWCSRHHDGSSACYSYWDSPNGEEPWRHQVVPGFSNAIDLAIGFGFQCALIQNASGSAQVSCSANYTDPNAGFWSPTQSLSPQVLDIQGVKKIDASLVHLLWIAADDKVYVLGETSPSTPSLVPAVDQAVELATSDSGSTCAIQESGTVMCW